MNLKRLPAPGAPVVDLRCSPYCALRPVSVTDVRLEDTFWAPRLRINREVTIHAQLRHCEATGRVDNFRRAAGQLEGQFQGIFFNDSDVYKWAEAASWSLAAHPDAGLDADLDGIIAVVAAAQEADGYLNTYFTGDRKAERFANLKDMHEIYCAGHLFQAAAAHYRATRKETLLGVAIRLADHLYGMFGPGGRVGACGHEEAEMGLVELARITGDPRYLELARLMIEARGREPRALGGSQYHQDHLPVSEQREMVGHAVRHLYLCCGVADVVAETGNPKYLAALDGLWNNFTQKKMYITGGAGARWEGEAFGADYELPNDRAYTETCAAIGSVMWNWRMLHLTGLPQYADVMEMTLYNAVLPGLSLDGEKYFYQNPLADRGKHRREEWFGCACCPPNVARLLASLPGYFYSTSHVGAYIHLFGASTARLEFGVGEFIALRQETDYPWSGEIEVHVEQAPERELSLYVRIPFWADATDVSITVNGDDAGVDPEDAPGQYCAVRRVWKAGDCLRLILPMPVEWVESHPHVIGNQGRIALQRGPLVYCVEQADNASLDPWDLALPFDAEFEAAEQLIEGHRVVALQTEAVVRRDDEWNSALYRPYVGADAAANEPAILTAIPYYAWANRAPGPMAVWLPVRIEE